MYTCVGFRSNWMTFQTLAKHPSAETESREECKEEEEEDQDDFSLPMPLFRLENYHGEWKRAEGKEPSGSREVKRKRSRRWGGCRWSWCEDENWFIAALMRSGMPGDSGCSPSPCCGNIKRNRGPPSWYNCCGDLSKGSRSLCRNLCNPDCWYPASYFQSPCLDAASSDIGHAFFSALLAALT